MQKSLCTCSLDLDQQFEGAAPVQRGGWTAVPSGLRRSLSQKLVKAAVPGQQGRHRCMCGWTQVASMIEHRYLAKHPTVSSSYQSAVWTSLRS
jgi:hypothetical protein